MNEDQNIAFHPLTLFLSLAGHFVVWMLLPTVTAVPTSIVLFVVLVST